MMKTSQGLKTKLYMLITALILVTLMTSLSLTYYLTYVTQEKLIRSQMRQMVDDKTKYMGEWILGKVNFTNTFYWYRQSTGKSVRFDQQVLAANGVSDVYEGHSDGSFFSWSGWLPPKGFDPRVRPWYVSMIAGKDFKISEPYLDLNSKQMAVSMGRPIYRGDEKIGVFAVDVLSQSVFEKIQKIDFSGLGYVWIVNEHGAFIVNPDVKAINRNVREIPELSASLAALPREVTGETRYKDGNSARTAYFRYVPYTNWILGTTIIENQAFKNLRDLQMLYLIVTVILCCIFVTLSYFLSRILSKPIIQIIEFVRLVASGDFDQKLNIHFSREIDDLADSLNDMAVQLNGNFRVIENQKKELAGYNVNLEKQVHERTAELEETNLKLRRSQEELEKQATTDFLTGLANRRHFFDLADKEMAKSQRTGRPYCLMIIDFDDFKHVNDSYGHEVGDDVLIAASHIMAESLRTYDTLARLGGEEFVVLLPETDSATALEIGERVRKALADQKIKTHKNELGITVSIGIATSESGVLDMGGLLPMADGALYAAKERGKNRVVGYWNTR